MARSQLFAALAPAAVTGRRTSKSKKTKSKKTRRSRSRTR